MFLSTIPLLETNSCDEQKWFKCPRQMRGTAWSDVTLLLIRATLCLVRCDAVENEHLAITAPSAFSSNSEPCW